MGWIVLSVHRSSPWHLKLIGNLNLQRWDFSVRQHSTTSSDLHGRSEWQLCHHPCSCSSQAQSSICVIAVLKESSCSHNYQLNSYWKQVFSQRGKTNSPLNKIWGYLSLRALILASQDGIQRQNYCLFCSGVKIQEDVDKCQNPPELRFRTHLFILHWGSWPLIETLVSHQQITVNYQSEAS